MSCITVRAALMIGGFGGSDTPIELIHALIDRFRAASSPSNLTVINNNAGNGKIGIAAMIGAGMVKKMICSLPRSSDPCVFTQKYLADKNRIGTGSTRHLDRADSRGRCGYV